jgi:hypothetical protein
MLLLACMTLCIHIAASAQVGVLRPVITPDNFEGLDKKISPEMQPALKQFQQSMMQSHILTVQNTWIQMLQQAGIPAVAITASSVEDARIEAKAKGAHQLLFTSVKPSSTDMSRLLQFLEWAKEQLSGIPGVSHAGIDQEIAKLTSGADEGAITRYKLQVTYKLEDTEGNTVAPGASVTNDSMRPSVDLWAIDGRAMITALGANLPQGKTNLLQPIPADISGGIHLNVVTRSQSLVNGKAFSPADESRQTIDLSSGSIAGKMNNTTVIFNVVDSNIFFLDSKQHSYWVLSTEDYAGMWSYVSALMEPQEQSPQLEPVGTEGAISRFRVTRENPGQTSVGANTTVEIETGDDYPGWKRLHDLLNSLPDTVPRFPLIQFGDDSDLSQMIWDKVIASDRPPKLIRIQTTVQGTGRANKYRVVNQADIAFDPPGPASVEDFTIPAGYTWRSSSVLSQLFAGGGPKRHSLLEERLKNIVGIPF